MSFMNLRVYVAFESSTILCEILTMFCLISGSVVLFMHCRTTRVGRYQKKHSPAHTHPGQRLPLSPFSICNGPRHPLYSDYMLDSPLEQPLSRSSLVFPWS